MRFIIVSREAPEVAGLYLGRDDAASTATNERQTLTKEQLQQIALASGNVENDIHRLSAKLRAKLEAEGAWGADRPPRRPP